MTAVDRPGDGQDERRPMGPCTECGTGHADCLGPLFCCTDCLHLAADWDVGTARMVLDMLGLIDGPGGRTILPDPERPATPGSLHGNGGHRAGNLARVHEEPRPRNCTTPPGLRDLPPLPAPPKAATARKPKPTLTAELEELERTDPAVAAAAQSYDRMVEKVTGRDLPSRDTPPTRSRSGCPPEPIRHGTLGGYRAHSRRGEPVHVTLSPAQVDVLDALCEGLSTADMAAKLSLSEDGVKSRIKVVLKALGATDRIHAVVLALTGQVLIRVTARTKAGAR